MMYSLEKEKINASWAYVQQKLFSEKNGMIHDHVVAGREQDLPTVKEIQSIFPNPCGYSTGMEDGMINGATMLDACLLRYVQEPTEKIADFARQIVRGQLSCACAANSEGFLPRGISIEDQKSHYPDSSRDQYTMFAFGMHRYVRSSLCTAAERTQIARIGVSIARRAEQNVIPEYGYDMLTDEGRPSLVTVMWGDSLGNHEYLRLPMLYLFAYEISRDLHWLEKYRALRAEAYKKSLPMGEYWALYTLQQMQASIRLCYDADPDTEWQRRYLRLMHEVADHAEGLTEKVRARMNMHSNYNMPQRSFRVLPMIPGQRFENLGYQNARTVQRPDMQDFFAMQDCAQLSIITGLVPDRVPNEEVQKLLWDAFDKIDLSCQERNLPLFFLDGYYRSLR